jgi:ABC-type multidrug transport system fused ATPase/permease subunit
MICYIVREKELRQKELMKMMSVVESDIGWAWFVSFAVFHLVSASCAAAVSAVLYEHSSLYLLWIFWELTFLAIIVFSMALSAISSKAARAVLIGLLIFFSGVFLTLAVDYRTGNPVLIGLISLHPVAAFTYGIKSIGYLEDLDLGLVSATLDYNESISGLSMMDILRYLGIDTLLWSFLSWYLNRVVTPDYGQALPFWFVFDPAYWCPCMCHGSTNLAARGSEQDAAEVDIPLEQVGDGLKRQAEQGKSIEIHNLRKDYGDKIAVDGLSLSMYSGHITALLGHNGT